MLADVVFGGDLQQIMRNYQSVVENQALGRADHPGLTAKLLQLIAIALAAGQVPNETNTRHFEALKEYFDERQIVQIVAVISMLGFINRWNVTMATKFDNKPIEFAQSVLAQGGWNVGNHEHAD